MNSCVQAIILAAGKSTRFHTQKTKLAEPICGQPMILFPTKLLTQLQIQTIAVLGFQQEIIENILTTEHGETIQFITQETQKGTGHALACTQHLWEKEHILVINGDMPLVTPEIITKLYQKHKDHNATISFVTAHNPPTTEKSYGRVVQAGGHIEIIEAKDFTGNLGDRYYINAGVYLINKNFLQKFIASLTTNNANQEFYITDLIKIASKNGHIVTTINVPFDTIRGINTLQELHDVEQIKRSEIITHWMNHGVRFASADHTYVDLAVTIEQGSSIGIGVHLRANTTIGKNCIIESFSSLEDVTLDDNVTVYQHCVIKNSYIQSNAQVGPFAHIRLNSSIGQHTKIGNFVEIKNSTLGEQTTAKHLTYLGDASVGDRVNIGAGTITCNYDGVSKNKTIIQDDVFIGSNNTIVAPLTIGTNAFTAAGSTITHDVPDNALAIARSYQTNKHNYAHKLKTLSAPQSPNDPPKETDRFSFVGARVLNPDIPTDEQ